MARYFVNPGVSRSRAARDGEGRYWRSVQTFSGWAQPGTTYAAIAAPGPGGAPPRDARFHFQVNLNLLAQLLDGPPPAMPAPLRLTAPIDYGLVHREDPGVGPNEAATIAVQPREVIDASNLAFGLQIGPRLAAFLDDPLGLGRPLGLGLPFMDPDTSVSQAWLRDGARRRAMHGGFDFSVLENPGERRPLIRACAAADGVVWMLLRNTGESGGVVLRHEPAPGVVFATLYQHLQPSSVRLAVGDRVRRGQRIGRIRRLFDENGRERSHIHFNVLVRSPVGITGLAAASRPWFSIDPFGVYDEHEPDSGSEYVYVPRGRGGMNSPIRGADRAIHWRGDPPITAFSRELQTPYARIRQLQARIRTRNAPSDPGEDTQFLVYLAGHAGFWFVRLKGARDLTMERELMALLRDAFVHGHSVQLGFRYDEGRRYVSAVWVRR